MGGLTVGSGGTATLNVTASTAPPDTPYGLTLGATTLNSNLIVNVSNNGSGLGQLTLSNVSGGHSLTMTGAGELILDGTNTYAGPTTVLSGVIDVTGSLANNGSASVFVNAGTDFSSASIVRNVALGVAYTGLGSTATGSAPQLLGTRADIRLGQDNSVASAAVAMQWRVRAASEIPLAQPDLATGPPPVENDLISDVLQISGMSQSSGTHVQTDPFVLQMTYSTSTLGGQESELAGGGDIYLGWLNTGVDQPTGLWQNATAGDFGSGVAGSVFLDVQSSWDSFASLHDVTNSNLINFLGSYGVDVTDHEVWAVVDHNSQFAVVGVAGPPSVALLVIGATAIFFSVGLRCRAHVGFGSASRPIQTAC